MPGDDVYLSIDINLQFIAEKSLAAQLGTLSGTYCGKLGCSTRTKSGSVVVEDPRNGQVLAMASYPTYDPELFVGGVSSDDYKALTATGNQQPLVNKAIAGTYAPGSSTYRWMGSVAMVKVGNLAVGYSKSSGSLNPSINYAGRLVTDAKGQLQKEETLFAGTGSQTGTLHRWGDYSALTIDPVDDCTMWYTTEYLKTNGTFNWSTRIGSFSFPSCTAP